MTDDTPSLRRWTVRALLERHVTDVVDAPDSKTAERIFLERLRLAPNEQAIVWPPQQATVFTSRKEHT